METSIRGKTNAHIDDDDPNEDAKQLVLKMRNAFIMTQTRYENYRKTERERGERA